MIEEEDDDRGIINARDFMHDFATQEFLEKNIRVKPSSDLLRGEGEDAKTVDGGMGTSKQDAFGNNVDDDE